MGSNIVIWYHHIVLPFFFSEVMKNFTSSYVRTATKFFKIFERKECELILGYRLKLYLLIIIGATDSSSGLDGGLSKETVDCRNKRWIK